jgi:hypothetical protein
MTEKELYWEKLLLEWERRGYIKENGSEYNLIIEVEILNLTDHVEQDLSLFISSIVGKKSFTYNDFKKRDMETM